MDPETYQRLRQENILDNMKVLREIGIDAMNTQVNSAKPAAAVAEKSKTLKRKQDPAVPKTRTTRMSLRSGSENQNDQIPVEDDEVEAPSSPIKKRENVFGAIPDVKIGTIFSTRLECSRVGLHRPTVAGIHGKDTEGCYSLALSGGYEDDTDNGYSFTYTGAGGRDLKGTKANPKNLRTAPQSKNQTLTGVNLALSMNVSNGNPVRVIRGYKLDSLFAPEEGYRYDGLYAVKKFWCEIGTAGFLVYKYFLGRIEDQDQAPWEVEGFKCASEKRAK